MIIRKLYQDRFIPTFDIVNRWQLYLEPTDLKCPSLQVNDAVDFTVRDLELGCYMGKVKLGMPYLDDNKTPIVILDKGPFSMLNLKYGLGNFPTVRVHYGKHSVEAIAKPSLLTILSKDKEGVKRIIVNLFPYGEQLFQNVYCIKTSMVKEDTLLIPSHLWTLFRFEDNIQIIDHE